MSENDIVISGIAGRFPESDNIYEFWTYLIEGKPAYTADERRWPFGTLDLPPFNGKIKDITKTDYKFFKYNKNEINLDPQIRILHEVVYEAIFDAGIIPENLRDSKTSVFVGLCYDDTKQTILSDVDSVMSNERIYISDMPSVSIAFGFKGPTTVIDTACASSFSALNEGLLHMKAGHCDQLIVGGVACHLRPAVCCGFKRLRMISPDGMSKCLDASVNGYCRSEAVNAIFIQRRKYAKRIYASIYKIKTNCDGFKAEGITFPGFEMQRKLLRETIKESGINPQSINYIEAHVTGTIVGDPIESNAIIQSYRDGSNKPILFGCLKSNIGHTEGASANCAIAKVALIFQKHCIPPNLNYKTPNPNIEALIKKQIIPVLEKREFHDEIIPVNAFGFGGVNVHAILKANEKVVTNESYKIIEDIPRLVNISGRTEEGLEYAMNWIQSNRKDVTKDFLALLNDVSKTRLETGMYCRAFMILDEKSVLKRRVFRGEKRRPLWFVFSALGCQWKAMAEQLMQIQIFADSVNKCAKTVKSIGIDVVDILTNSDCDFENDIIKTLVAIVSIQIALVDVLSYLGVKPDGMIGYSLGDVVAGYCDGCLSAEEAVLVAYFIGKCSFETQKEKGSMAAIGLNWNQAIKRCPPGVFPSCDNCDDGITVSGKQSILKKFVAELQSSNTFAVEVNSCEMAYHCPLANDAFDSLKRNLTTVIKNPKRLSNRWVSTIAAKANALKLCDATFFAQVVVSTVHLRNSLNNVPSNACIVEIGPHSNLLPLIKRQLRNSLCVPLMKRNSDRCIVNLLSGIGEIFCSGNNPSIENLYSKVEYPVPRETLSLSHLLKWDHSDDVFTIKYPDNFKCSSLDVGSVEFSVMDVNWSFLLSHCVDGRNLFPATGYLHAIWKAQVFALTKSDIIDTPIEFRNVYFHRATILPKEGTLKLNFYRNKDTSQFTITDGTSLCVTGEISEPHECNEPNTDILVETEQEAVLLETKDIYKELRVRGYDYGPSFQGLVEAYSDGSKGKVKSTGHWISLTDSMLHLAILANDERTLCVPTFIEYMKCEPKLLFAALKRNETLDVFYDKYAKIGITTGLIVKGLKVTPVAKRVEQNPYIKYFKFHPFFNIIETPIEKMKLFHRYEKCCLSLLNALQSKKKYENGTKLEFDDTLNKEYVLYHKLKDAVTDTFDCNAFFDKFTKEDRSMFLFEINYNDVIKPQLSCAIDNTVKELNVVEYNTTAAKEEKVIGELSSWSQVKLIYTCYPMSNEDTKLPVTSKDLNLVVYKCWSTQLIVDNKSWKNREELYGIFHSFYSSLSDEGFLCVSYRTKLTELEKQILRLRSMLTFDLFDLNVLREIPLSFGLKLVAEKSDDIGIVSLLFKKVETIRKYVVIKPTHKNYDWIENIKKELKKEKSIWLLGDERVNGVLGLTNCLRKEPGGNKVHCFIGKDSFISNDIYENGLGKQMMQTEKVGYYCRETVQEAFTATKDAFLSVKTKGDLSSFQWFEASHKHWDSLPLNERDQNLIKIHVFYAALNFKDIMVATGRIPTNAYPSKSSFGCLGMEYSGIDENGNRVCGVCIKNSIATTLMIHNQEDLTFPVPRNWTLEEAATVPVVYLTVYYALLIRGKLLPKETVLIHAGSGGVGQAAIGVCLSMGCEVYTSVGTQEKKQFLKNLFPQLEDKHFVNSRNLSFEEHILKETNGRGVDIVLNSLAEEKLRASINCLADFGRFIEIGKFDIIQNNPLDWSRFERNITFHVVCVAHLLRQFVEKESKQAQRFHQQLVAMVTEGLKSGKLKPLNRAVFSSDEIEKAFRFMASAKHTGKVLIKIREESENLTTLKPLTVNAVSQTYLHPLKVYLLIGGLGGIGLELGHWLAERGAKKLVFTSRTGIQKSYQNYRIKEIEKQGVTVKIMRSDASTLKLTQQLIKEALTMGEIGGIFNLAMLLSDALVENQTEEMYRSVCIPKVNTTLYLDEVTRKHCSQLEYFVCFSSLACGVGNAAQSNYGFANSVMESICEKRRADNLHGVAIQWGAVGDVGFVLENFKTNDVVIGGSVPQRIPSCMKTIDMLINSPHCIYSSYVPLDISGSVGGSKGYLLKKITHILGVSDPSTLDDNTTLGDLGLDSLMAVEIKQGLERDYNTFVSTQEIRQLTVQQIRELSAKQTSKACNLNSDNESKCVSNFETPKELFTKLDKGNQGVPIFFIPPVEGDFKLIKPLVDYITRPVIGINWTGEIDPLMSIEEVAAFYVKKLREKYPQPEYEFVAYSFGSLIAFEMGIQLQAIDKNLSKKLFILDGDIDLIKHEIMDIIKKRNISNGIDTFQECLFGLMSLIYPSEIVEKLHKDVITLSSKDEQIKRTVDFINVLGYEKCTEELLKLAVQRLFDKLKRIHAYEPKTKFKGKVKLICSTREKDLPAPESTKSKFRQNIDGSLDVKTLIGDHRSFLTNNYKEIGNLLDEQLYYISS